MNAYTNAKTRMHIQRHLKYDMCKAKSQSPVSCLIALLTKLAWQELMMPQHTMRLSLQRTIGLNRGAANIHPTFQSASLAFRLSSRNKFATVRALIFGTAQGRRLSLFEHTVS